MVIGVCYANPSRHKRENIQQKKAGKNKKDDKTICSRVTHLIRRPVLQLIVRLSKRNSGNQGI
jgi:hypothetical protein